MRRALLIFPLLAALLAWMPLSALAQSTPYSSLPADPPAVSGDSRIVDGIAARIEDDIITESEVRELERFQILVDGKSRPRGEVLEELENQWILRGEASAVKFPEPSKDDVERSYAQFTRQFGPPEEYAKRCTAAGVTDSAVHRLIQQQLYLSRFVDYRFRPAAQIDQKQIEDYYSQEFAPQLKQRGESVPPLDDVEETIREVLVQRAINSLSAKWLDDTRARLRIDVLPEGASQ
jgi:hypothetical protein